MSGGAKSGVRLAWCTVGAFQENCYLVVDEATRRGVLVDPGAEAPRLIRMVQDADVELEAIWLTHAHIDHVGALAAVKRAWDVPVYMHPADAPLLERLPLVSQMFGVPPVEQPAPPERALAEGDRVRVGSLEFEVLHMPGHAPGLCIFVGAGIAIAGDLLFAGSIGRTDLPFCDPAAMQRSLARLPALPEETVVYPGHGPATTIARELASNPFLTGVALVPTRAPR